MTTLTTLEGCDLFDRDGNEIGYQDLVEQFAKRAWVVEVFQRQDSDPEWSADCTIYTFTPLDAQGYRKPLEQLVIYARS